MNRAMRKVAIILGVLLIAIFVNLNYIQVVKGSSYRDNPTNARVLLNEYSHARGQIVVGGSAIASSKETTDELKYLRTYTDGPVYAPVTGYYSFIYGTSGIEESENSVLAGTDSRLFGSQLADILTGRNPRGGTVDLTLNADAQKAAYAAMKGADGKMRPGAVVALDPTTGAILAAVSTPSYDPNQLSSHDSDEVTKAWASYCKPVGDNCTNPDDPLLNRAFNQTYPPGSTFKIVTAAAALSDGRATPTTKVPAPNAYWPLDPTRTSACPASLSAPCVENFAGETCDNGKTATLTFAFAKSCNTAFAELGVKEGGVALAAQAKAFGLDSSQLNVPLPVATSTVGSLQSLASDDAYLAQSSFGQRDVRVTPLQDAMLAAAVANEGTLMQPYLVSEELGPNLATLTKTSPQQIGQAVNSGVAQQLQQMMEAVVTAPEGTGHLAAVPGYVVGGKTGTADTGVTSGSGAQPDAWFTGFALQGGNAKIAIAVVLENGGVNGDESAGGLAAAPVAQKVMKAYLDSISGH
jgi:peptidoglycan glycosyltransferase